MLSKKTQNTAVHVHASTLLQTHDRLLMFPETSKYLHIHLTFFNRMLVAYAANL